MLFYTAFLWIYCFSNGDRTESHLDNLSVQRPAGAVSVKTPRHQQGNSTDCREPGEEAVTEVLAVGKQASLESKLCLVFHGTIHKLQRH